MDVNIVSNNFGEDGIGQYSQKLYEQLCECDRVCAQKVEFKFERKEVQVDKNSVMRSWNIPLIDNHLLFGVRNKDVLKRLEGDLSHISTQTFSYLDADPKVVTCHDLKTLKQSNGMIINSANKIKYSGVASADHVIAISKYGKRQIQKWFDIPEEDITAVYQGVGRPFKPIDADFEPLRRKYRIPDREYYILHVGVAWANKNIPRLVEALAQVVNNLDVQLIRVGSQRDPHVRKRIENAITEYNLQNRVSVLDHVPTEDLVKLYNLADVFTFPSLSEGFGRPPLEAMACGTPTIVSDVTSLPEVVGNAGRTIDPERPDELAAELRTVLASDTLQRRLSKRGKERAKKFDWERTARKTADVYQNVIDDESSRSE